MNGFKSLQESRAVTSSTLVRAENFWGTKQRQLTFRLFHSMTKGVTAYKRYLSKARVKVKNIKKYSDISAIPPISKTNYFKKFPLTETTWKNLLREKGQVMTATSGSTGSPTYFPRTEDVDEHYSLIAEFFLKNGPKGSTLLVDCFGMGVWIGGLITYQAFRITALRGHPVTIITPGINKKEIFHALRNLAINFDNVILAGYPPFIKDLLDEAKLEKIDFSKFNLRLLFAAESFTENFRDYVAKKGKIKNIYNDTLNLYGSAELGAMAFETPASIFIRRLALQHAEVYQELFSDNKIPTLAQYNSSFIAFDEEEGKVLISADSATPFLRYDIGDRGGTYKLSEIIAAFSRNGIDLISEAKKAKVSLNALPFVYVYERSDFSTTLYGLQVYPQTVKIALESRTLHPYLTGKFSMRTVYDKKSNQFLEVNVEMKPRVAVSKKLKTITQKSIVSTLLQHNSEYKELTKMLGIKRTAPYIVFWTYNHDTHFKSGIKQQWLNKA
jgi:phenylacetate-CoA ligase